MDNTLVQPKFAGVSPENEALVQADLSRGLTLGEARRNLVANAEYQRRLGASTNPISNVFDGSSLSQNQQAFQLPQNQPTLSPATEIIANAQASADAFTKAQAETDKAFAGVGQSLQKRTGFIDALRAKFGLVSDVQKEAAEAEASIDPFRKELADINTKIADTTIEFRNVQDQIKGRGDIPEEAQRGLLFNAEERYGRVLADLSIRQAAANGNIEQMERSADRKLQMKLAPLMTEIQFLQDVALKNADIFTKAEQEKVSALIAEKNRQVDAITARENQITDILKQATLNGIHIPDEIVRQILRASSPSEAYQILARNGISLADPLDRQIKGLQRDKLQAEIDAINNPAQGIDAGSPEGQLASMGQILASKFGTKFQQQSFLGNLNRLASGGNPQQVADFIFSEAINQISDSEARKKAISQYKITNKLNTLEEQLAAYVAKGGDVGLITGTAEQIRNKLGNLGNKEIASLGISMLDTLDQLARDRTGAVISASEEKFYDRLLPSTRKSAELNQAVINGLRSSLTSDLNSVLRFQLTGTGFNSIEPYLGFQASGNLIEAAKQGKVQVAPNGDLILITN